MSDICQICGAPAEIGQRDQHGILAPYCAEHAPSELLPATTPAPGTHSLRYDAMCRAIDACHRVDEVKELRNQAKAFEEYARQAQNTEAERKACEIRLRAERRAGEFSAAMEKRQGSRTDQLSSAAIQSKKQQLEQAGISRVQASQWERLADIPQDHFEAMLGGADKPTTSGMIRQTTPPKPNPVSDDALWLWGRLRDFDSKILRRGPANVLSTMTPEMLNDVHTLAPRVAEWLKRVGSLNVIEF